MNKKINSYAVPLFLSSITSLIIGLCDQAIIGHISVEAVASVGMISNLINSITGVVGATSIVFNMKGSYLKGKGVPEEINKHYTFHIIISIIIGLFCFLGFYFSSDLVLAALFNLEGNTLKDAQHYLIIYSLTIGVNMLIFTCTTYLKIKHRTKSIFWSSLTVSILNVVFDYILVFGYLGFPEMGMVGNAIGSLLALGVQLGIYIFILRNEALVYLSRKDWVILSKETWKITIPISGQELIESTLFILLMNTILAQVDLLYVSTYNVLFSIITVLLMPMYAYAQSALTFTSEKPNKIKIISFQCIKMSSFFYIIMSILCLAFGKQVLMLLTNQYLLIEKAISIMPLAIVSHLLIIPSTIYKFVLQAVKYEKWVFWLSSIVHLFGIVMMYILLHIFGLIGTYFAIGLIHVIQFVLFKRKILVNIK